MKTFAWFLTGLLAFLTLNGCAGFFVKPPPLSFEAAQALALLEKQKHSRLESFKGLGRVVLQAGAARRTISLAWLVQLPNKMRFEVLTPTGHSLLTVAADGRYIYFLPHAAFGRLQKHRAKNINLERIIGVPVKKDDLLALLAGSFPVRPYDSVQLSGDHRNGYVLDLKKRWRGVVERIYFDGTIETPYKVELLGGWNDEILCSATIRDWQQTDGFKVPREIILEDGDDLAVKVVIRRYWVETDIAAEQFVLTDGE